MYILNTYVGLIHGSQKQEFKYAPNRTTLLGMLRRNAGSKKKIVIVKC